MPSSWLSAMDDVMDGVVHRGQEQERWRADATRRGERPNGSHETKTTIGHADARYSGRARHLDTEGKRFTPSLSIVLSMGARKI